MNRRLAAATVPLMLALAACGGASKAGSSADPSSASQSVPVVQPCDAVDLAPVEAILGHDLQKKTGTASAPDCALIPTVQGGAVFRLNYTWWYKGGLEQAWKTMKNLSGTVTHVDVPGADDAKLVVGHEKRAALITGFVEDGNLIQVVNGVALPRNAAKLREATLLLMRQLSEGAPSPSPSASASTSAS